MKVKQNLNLEENVKEELNRQAKALGFNVSSYITYLVNLNKK